MYGGTREGCVDADGLGLGVAETQFAVHGTAVSRDLEGVVRTARVVEVLEDKEPVVAAVVRSKNCPSCSVRAGCARALQH